MKINVLHIFLVIFLLIIFSIYEGVSIIFPLAFGLLLFSFYAKKMGYGFSEIFEMIISGGKKSFVVIKIFVLIGGITAVWMACGTVPYIVYLGIKYINPNYFVLSAFLISSITSYLIGSAFGTVGTIGLALMILAKGAGINLNVAAGAIIAGAYFGDRCSPMSSSANLIATITETDLYRNVINMAKTSIVPYVFSIGIYLFLSLRNPLKIYDNTLERAISHSFYLTPYLLLPAVIIIVLSLFRVNVKLSMFLSTIAGIILGIIFQNRSLWDFIYYYFMGFNMDGESFIGEIIKGGGVVSMVRVSLIVFISSAYGGIFERTGILKHIEDRLISFSTKVGRYLTTLFTSFFAAAFGCTQALAVILTHQLVKNIYGDDRYQMALDMENTAIIISPLIPWNIAGAVPAAILSVGYGFIIYSVYIYLLPLMNIHLKKVKTHTL